MQRAIQMYARLLMHRHPIRPRVSKGRDELVRVLDHQMAIERQFCCFAQRLYNRRANCEIRNEVSVHDVDMNDTRATLGCGAYLFTESSEISRKN